MGGFGEEVEKDLAVALVRCFEPSSRQHTDEGYVAVGYGETREWD